MSKADSKSEVYTLDASLRDADADTVRRELVLVGTAAAQVRAEFEKAKEDFKSSQRASEQRIQSLELELARVSAQAGSGMDAKSSAFGEQSLEQILAQKVACEKYLDTLTDVYSRRIMEREQKMSKLCIVCNAGALDCVVIPCGHSKACFKCVTAIQSKDSLCPVCRLPFSIARQLSA